VREGPEISELVGQWLEKAGNDLINAGHTLLPPRLVLPASVEDLARLTPYATSVRYPGAWSSPVREDAEWAVAAARRLLEAARSWVAGRI